MATYNEDSLKWKLICRFSIAQSLETAGAVWFKGFLAKGSGVCGRMPAHRGRLFAGSETT